MTQREKQYIVRSLGIVLFIVICIGVVITAADAMTLKPDQSFVNKATIGNEFEIESSRIALQKSQNSDVKEFAQHMIDDHTKIGNRLEEVLSASDAAVPVPDNKLDHAHRKILDQLNAAAYENFDRQYIKAQTDAHDDAISLFKDYAAHGDNDALKGFAARTLPIIEKHREDIPELD